MFCLVLLEDYVRDLELSDHSVECHVIPTDLGWDFRLKHPRHLGLVLMAPVESICDPIHIQMRRLFSLPVQISSSSPAGIKLV